MKWMSVKDLQSMGHVYQEVLLFDGKDVEYGCIYWNGNEQGMVIEHEGIASEEFTHFIPLSHIPWPIEP